VFNLEEFMNNEFLRPKENRCKWFNNVGVMREWVYTENECKCNFRAKTTKRINSLNEWIDSDCKNAS